MAEYIEREAAIDAIMKVYVGTAGYKARERVFEAEEAVHRLPVADVAPVVHGRWIEHEETQEDAYSHHKCSECNVNAPFYYKMREDWDEGMDGEWYSIGLVDDGINEYLTDYCPNCGARMDGDDDAKPEE